MSKKQWVVLIFILGIYPICKWDYYLSNYLFKQYCADADHIGLFVYEKVQLDDKYFMPFPKDTDRRDLDRRFIVGDNLIINRERFDKDYIFNVYKRVPLSNVGPIVAIETSVIRKNDKKLLGKAVSLASGKGWWYRKIASFGQPTSDTCPSGRDENHFPRYRLTHYALIKEVFKQAEQGD